MVGKTVSRRALRAVRIWGAASVAWVALCAAPLAQAHRAHVHGVAQLELAVDGPVLQVSVHGPLDNVLGFEHAPRTEREKRAYDAALQRLRSGGEWFTPNPEAGCTREYQDVEHEREGNDSHADVELTVQWRCAQPALLRSLRVTLWPVMPRLQRLEAAVVLPQASRKVVLRRPASGEAAVLRWGAGAP